MGGEGAKVTGFYERKQGGCGDPIIRWSHGARFRKAAREVAPWAGGRLLDFGCGDGTFLRTLEDSFPDAVGMDVDPGSVQFCQQAASPRSRQSFFPSAQLSQERFQGAFDVITCLEVLEHCTDAEVEETLLSFRRALRPGGVLLVSVPIEIGPALVVKQTVRYLAGLRRLGDYATMERYSWSELGTMVFAGEGTAIARPRWAAGLGHKGFNWRRLRAHLRRHFKVKRTSFSPLPWSGGWFSSQVWFLAQVS